MCSRFGNVNANKDVNGDMVREAEYWPYGEIRTETDSNPTPFGYGGTWGYYSDPSGMLYVRARYYRPIEGRWLTVDPLWPGQGAYTYCGSMPISSIDFDGRLCWTWTTPCSGSDFATASKQCKMLYGTSVMVCARFHIKCLCLPEFSIGIRQCFAGTKGDCPPMLFAVLSAAVATACKGGVVQKCIAGESCITMLAKIYAPLTCAQAREALNNICFRGGDWGHQVAVNGYLNAAANCMSLLGTCQ